MELNENIIKFTGSCSLPQSLDLDGDYAAGIKFNVTSKEEKKRDDGTYDLVHKGQLLEIIISDKLGNKIYSKDKTRSSVKLRFAILSLKDKYQPEMEDEAFYKLVMGKLTWYLPTLIETLLNAQSIIQN